jgi:Domain of unknown function (DUF4186)
MAETKKDTKKRKKKLPKLGVTCTDSRCDQGLHCFRPKRGMSREQIGACRSCGEDNLVDWERVHQRDPADVEYLRGVLPLELIRHELWRVEIPDHVRDLALRPRRGTLEELIKRNVRRSVGPPASELFRDGTQTPMPSSENARIFHYGQHATATCCRKCLEYWHGIAAEVPLSTNDLEYMNGLVWRYVDERLSE